MPGKVPGFQSPPAARHGTPESFGMKLRHLALYLTLLLCGCSSATWNNPLPFRRTELVATYPLSDLQKLVDEQYHRRHDLDSQDFKHYPSPKEFAVLTMGAKSGDQVVEFKNLEFWVAEDRICPDAAVAFCLTRDGKRVKTVLVWELGE